MYPYACMDVNYSVSQASITHAGVAMSQPFWICTSHILEVGAANGFATGATKPNLLNLEA